MQRDEQRALARVLWMLPEEHREVLVLREIEDMDYREICEVTGLPMGRLCLASHGPVLASRRNGSRKPGEQPMDCAEALRVQAYFDGELEPADAAEVERHLASCKECQSLIQDLNQVRTMLRAGNLMPVAPAALRSQIQDALDQEAQCLFELGVRAAALDRSGWEP